jgi:sortase A
MPTQRTLLRRLAVLLVVGGLVVLGWVGVTWRWQEPLTALYTKYEQRQLGERYDVLARNVGRRVGDLAATARAYRLGVERGDPIGRLSISRLGLDMMLVEGTDEVSLKKGPGRDERSRMPGEGGLVYVAGHRTTYLAPFAHIEKLRAGDRIHLEMPYADFTYEVAGHWIVDKADLSVLRSPGHETIRLQACHPRFFATERYVVFANLLAVTPPSTVREAVAAGVHRRTA